MKVLVTSLVLIFVFLTSLASDASSISHVSHQLDEVSRQEPSFSDIISEAYKSEKLEWGQVSRWQHEMKTAPWLPTFYAGYDRTIREQNAISISDNISVTQNGVAVGPRDNNFDRYVNSGDVLHFRAVWSLDEVVFHPSTLQAANAEREISKSRISLSDYLFKIYAERRKTMGEYFLLKGTDDTKQILLREKIRACTEKLDSFTNGIFADRWWRDK